MRRLIRRLCIILALFALNGYSALEQTVAQPPEVAKSVTNAMSAAERTRSVVNEIIEEAYPELQPRDVEIKTFSSRSNYFKAQFSFGRYFTFRRMRSIIYVNPLVFERNVPEDGLRAIVAHELAHVSYYLDRNRLKLFGLVRLAGDGFTRDFERKADLLAISRGFGDELITYRHWLYGNVPPEKVVRKKRDYFTPEEIELLIPAIESKPAVLRQFYRRVPRNLSEVKSAVKALK